MKPADFVVEVKIATVAQAVQDLISKLDEASKTELKGLTDSRQLVAYHHGFGTGIRNNYGLWKGNKRLLNDCKRIATKKQMVLTPVEDDLIHPDDASHIIMVALWEKLREK